MSCTVAIYARTSPDCPLPADHQIEHLKTVAADRRWTVTKVFSDRPASVKKDRRPGEMALLDAIRAGEVQKVLMVGIDRMGRSLADLVSVLETCRAAGVSLWLDQEKLDTTASNGLSLFDVAGMMAHHLRQGRRGKILRGQQAARAASVKFGRPKLIDIKPAKVQRAKEALNAGMPLRKVARMTGISTTSVSRLKTNLEQAAAPA